MTILSRSLLVTFLSLIFSLPSQAATLKSAEITAIVNDVKVANPSQGLREAKLNETISGQTSVQTGLKSRTELLFSDKTMARLGANSMFSFTNGTRDIDLQQGTMLLQVPKGAGGAKITTAAVTAAITGTTIMIEYFPGGYSKVIVLEGTLRLFLTNRVGESILLEPGKMIILSPNATQLPEPVDVDIKRLVKTSKLIRGIDGTDLDLKLVENEITRQEKEKKKGNLIGTNLVITGSGTEVILASEDLLNTLENASLQNRTQLGERNSGGFVPGGPSNPVTPVNPNKYQPVATITNPNPYVINSTTTIVTDPTITTNGVTSQGTLYNSTVQPGNTSTFLFGSTSAFDTASGFDSAFLGQDYSVFRFSELQFLGNPSLNTTGGPKNLFLVSETNISTGAGVFNLDFTGLDFLGFATANGYISLSHPLTGPAQVDLHARGAGASYEGTIFVDGPITLGAGSTLNAYAQSALYLNALVTADNINLRSYGDLDISAGGGQFDGIHVDLNASNRVLINDDSIAGTRLQTINVAGGEIYIGGSLDFTAITANFTAGTSGISGNAGTSILNAASILSSGNINFYSTNTSDISASGIVAASGYVDVSGHLSAGSIGAGADITAHKLTSASNINSTTGNITAQSGDMTAANNITAAGSIISATAIVAGDLLQAAEITAGGNISGGAIKTTSGNVTSTGGTISSTTGKIESAADINAMGGGISSANDILAAGDVVADGSISAIGIISGQDILANGSGGSITSGGNITAAGDLGTLYANTGTTSTGLITADRILGGDDPGAASGSTTFTAGTIVAGDVVVRNGDNPITLDAGTITVNAQSTSISSSTFSSAVTILTLNGASAITLSVASPWGNPSTHLSSLTTNSNVTISGSQELYVSSAALGNSLSLSGANGNLYTDNMTVSGNLSVNQIKRFGAIQAITVTGNIQASGTYGLDFQGTGGADGGNLTLNGAGIIFDNAVGAVNGANFVGGDQTGGNGGIGGTLNVNSSASLNLNSASSIFAHGGSGSGGNGGDGGTVNLSATGANAILTSTGTVDARGGAGDNAGGNGGAIVLAANNSDGQVNHNGGSLNASGGAAAAGPGGSGGNVELHAEGSSGQVNTLPYSSIQVNGGNSSNGAGGNGGSILMKANGAGGGISHASYSASSANGGNSTGFKGGSGGNINLAGDSVATGASTTLSAVGGDALAGSNEGGDGGNFTVTGTSYDHQGSINLATGGNSGVTYGGSGGTADVTTGNAINISGIIKTSEDAAGPRMSKNGGKIQLVSNETDSAKPGITIANSGQLLALLNAASPGKGGRITLTSSGGKINLAGALNAGKKGGGGVSGTDGVLKVVNNGTGGTIDIASTASLRGDVIKVGALSNNGVLTIRAGSTINADTQIKLFGGQGAGMVLFTDPGTVNLSAGSAIAISANTVQVNTGTTVNNAAPSTTVYANNHNYNIGGYGSFQNAVINGGAPLAPGGF